MGKLGQRVEQDELRARMRAAGMSHDEIAVEFARRYKLRPRVAHRVAYGWTLQQAANRINAHAARTGVDPDGIAAMTAPRLSELENWPVPLRRRPTPQILALLAEVYGTDVHNLIDLDDREQMPSGDQLLMNTMRRGGGTVVGQPSSSPPTVSTAIDRAYSDAVLERALGIVVSVTAVSVNTEPNCVATTRPLPVLGRTPTGDPRDDKASPMAPETSSTAELVSRFTRDDLAVDRREAARTVVGVLVGAALLERVERWLAASEPFPTPRRTAGVGYQEIEQIEHAARIFRAWDNQFGGGLRRKAVVGQLAEVADELHDFSHPADLTRRLHSAMADLAETAATMSWDSGQGGIAQRYYLLALRSARTADDPASCVNILAGMARQQFYLDRAAEGLELVRLAQDVADGRVTPAVRAMLCTREAWAYAKQGRLAAFRRATSRAQDQLRDVDPAAEPYWISYFDQAELVGVTGGRLLDVAHQSPGYADEAASWLSQSVELRGSHSLRSAALDQLGFAEIRLVQGEFDEAARLGHDALTTVEQTRSSRVRVKLAEFYRHAETRTSARPVAELCARIKLVLNAG
ncbi:hypothetical protein [Frankia sp. Cr1]|uniref:hypothetical protein n=1 Tax=Frankia sp. Cr1 TaxID=3073931 RepID=UPI002AD2FF97|nr:hypothetical protein [Frankia sp. Cr1]